MPTHDETRGDVDYFVLLIIMASFLLLNVFVAIILDNFKRMSGSSMSILLDKVDPEEEEECISLPLRSQHRQPPRGRRCGIREKGIGTSHELTPGWARCLTLAAEHATHGASRP